MLQAKNFTQSIPAKVTVEYCRLDQGGAPGVDGGDVLHDGLHLVRHLQVLQVTLLIQKDKNTKIHKLHLVRHLQILQVTNLTQKDKNTKEKNTKRQRTKRQKLQMVSHLQVLQVTLLTQRDKNIKRQKI